MRKLSWVALVLVFLAGLTAGVIYKTRRDNATPDVASVEKDIGDHLPLGTLRAKVELYLEQRGIQHSYVDRSNGAPGYNRTEMAMIRGASRAGLVRKDVQILFKFDDQDRLVHYSVQQIFTGP
jgi:hypothetical protein